MDDKIIRVSVTNDDGKEINLLAEADYYAKHPEELNLIPDDSSIHSSIRVVISTAVAIAILLLCIAIGFAIFYGA